MERYLLPISCVLLLCVLIIELVLLRRSSVIRSDGERRDAFRKLLKDELKDTEDDITASVRNLGESNLHAVGKLGELLESGRERGEKAQIAALDLLNDNLNDDLARMEQSLNRLLSLMQETLANQMGQFRASVSERTSNLESRLGSEMQLLDRRMESLEKKNDEKLEAIRRSVDEEISAIREETGKRLEEIRNTVDEKLQSALEKRISESFKTVSDQLEQVYRGLGEMQTLAGDVGGLKKVLSGVKTRGILGEVQLGAILAEILAPEQYELNVATIPGSSERVEFAVKLPAKDGCIYLPIDSKFPGDRWSALLDARDAGDKLAEENAGKDLENVLRSEAKDIRTKYVEPPYTTNFGIMFLPFEGLYAEVVNRGLVEVLQRDCHVNVAGPSTMAALLNSLQMGFRTLAIQKRSGEVWELLGAVKTEFDKFEDMLLRMQTHLNQTSGDLELLMGQRTRAIRRKLRGVQELNEEQAGELLGLGQQEEQD